jgi:fatty-acyl-CoA synthase
MFHANAGGYPHAIFWCGGDLILPHRFLKPDQLVPLMERERPTFVNGVPTIWIDVLRYLREHPDADISSITRIVVGGSATPRALMQAFRDEYDIPLTQGWGMTETSPLVTLARPRRGHVGEAALEDALSQGRVLAGVELRLVHPETGAPVPHDGRSVGELELRGPWITASYLSEADPGKFHDGWLRTGDIGTLDPDGYVRLTDRAKDAVKSGGEWISSIGLEAEVAAHPQVIEAAVIGVPDERWGERPCVVVTMVPGSAVTGEDLRDWLDGRVARWWLPERCVRRRDPRAPASGNTTSACSAPSTPPASSTSSRSAPRRPASPARWHPGYARAVLSRSLGAGDPARRLTTEAACSP